MGVQPIYPIKVFYCYAHEDNALREQLARHLTPLRRRRNITSWFDRHIQAGAEWEQEHKAQFDDADIILLLVSADFIASDYCYTVEMRRALERHQAGNAHVIPILLRPVDWEKTPLGALSPLPTNRIPVTQWANQDAAWLTIVQGINETVDMLLPKRLLTLPAPAPTMLAPGTLLLKYEHIGASALKIAWSPDWKYFASGGADATVRIWDAATGKTLLTLRGHSGAVIFVAWSPDGSQLAPSSMDLTVRVWDTISGRQLLSYGYDGDYDVRVISDLAWSPNGRLIAAGTFTH